MREYSDATLNKSSDDILIRGNDLSVIYGGNIVFKNVAFTIRKGEIIKISEKNGSGKTTLMRIMLKIQKADNGYILFKNGLITSYVSQNAVLFNRSFRENMLYPNSVQSNQKLMEIVSRFGLDTLISTEEDLERLPGDFQDKLSGGEIQKILNLKN